MILIETGMGDKHGAQVREKIFPGDYGYLPQSLAAAARERRGVARARRDGAARRAAQ